MTDNQNGQLPKSLETESAHAEEMANFSDMFAGAILTNCTFSGCTVNGKPLTADSDIFRGAEMHNVRVENEIVSDVKADDGTSVRIIEKARPRFDVSRLFRITKKLFER